MTEFGNLRPKSFRSLAENNYESQKAKVTRKCVIKQKLKLKDYNYCLEARQNET